MYISMDARQIKQFVFDNFDRNGDGKLAFSKPAGMPVDTWEKQAEIRSKTPFELRRDVDKYGVLMAQFVADADTDADGSLSEAEVLKRAEALIAGYDANGDGTILAEQGQNGPIVNGFFRSQTEFEGLVEQIVGLQKRWGVL